MPSIPLGIILQATLPQVPPPAKAVIAALTSARGRLRSAQQLAVSLGLRSRFRLARLLRGARLPPIRELADWICVLQLLLEVEGTGVSLQQIALSWHVDPPTCYRLVKRLTGLAWTDVRAAGFTWALLQFLGRAR